MTLNGRRVSWEWWATAEDGSNQAPEADDFEVLEELANDRVTEMIQEGYVSGELLAELGHDDSGEPTRHYRGWWQAAPTAT